jgi:hypothetical protein
MDRPLPAGTFCTVPRFRNSLVAEVSWISGDEGWSRNYGKKEWGRRCSRARRPLQDARCGGEGLVSYEATRGKKGMQAESVSAA